ncbi:MAG TPA: MFS transporter [Methylomirabilota bacterium]|nr:MFS transporter [Methylomirabilota bacterium]
MARWAILALVTLAYAAAALAALAVAPLAPFLRADLRLSRVEVGLLLPAVYLGGVLMSLPSGWLADRFGVRPTLALGVALTGALVALATVSPSLPLLLLCLVGAGFGFSVGNPATGKAVLDWFPARERGVAMGVKQTGLTLGGIAGALLLPPLAVKLGWRDALAVAGAFAALGGLAVVALYHSPPRREGAPATAQPRLSELGVFLIRPGVQVLFAGAFLLSMTQSSLLAYFALYARESFDVSAVLAGQLLALAQAGGAASRLGGGLVSDRALGGRRRPGVVAMALVGAAACVGFALGDALPHVLLWILALVAGIGVFGWVGLYFALVAEIGGARYAGLLTGVAVSCAWSGVLVGPPLFGLVVEATGGYTAAWLLLAGIAVTVALALARLQPLVHRAPVSARDD